MSLFLISETLGLFLNTLTTDDKHSPQNGGDLWQPIQIQLSRKKKFFQNFLLNF